MLTSKTLTTAIAAVCLLAQGRPSQAQDVVAGSFDQLRMIARLGDTITVTDTSGTEVTGRLADLSPASLELLVGGQRRIVGQQDVRMINGHGHANLATGARIGLAVGAGLGVLGGLALSSGCSECGGIVPAVGLIYGGLGAGVGVGVAALITTRPVIYAAPGATRTRVSVLPIITTHEHGVAMSFNLK